MRTTIASSAELGTRGRSAALVLAAWLASACGGPEAADRYPARIVAGDPALAIGALAPAGVPASRDARLAGLWSRQEMRFDAGRESAAQGMMRLDSAGRLTVGHAPATGSGAGWGRDSGLGDDAYSVYWRTEGNILQISAAADGPWQPLARYRVRGDRALFVYHDGSRELWRRR